MGIFEDIKLKWKEKEYTIPATNVLRAIAKVEEVMTLVQLGRALAEQTLPIAKISQAYGAVLRHAGAPVTDEEVYDGMFDSAEMRDNALTAISMLQALMMPPARIKVAAGKAATDAPVVTKTT